MYHQEEQVKNMTIELKMKHLLNQIVSYQKIHQVLKQVVTVEYQKVILHSSKPKENDIPKQSVGETQNINFQYNYQPQDLSSVYLVNRYLKSNSEVSTLASSFGTPSNCSSSLIKEHSQILSSSNDYYSILEQWKQKHIK